MSAMFPAAFPTSVASISTFKCAVGLGFDNPSPVYLKLQLVNIFSASVPFSLVCVRVCVSVCVRPCVSMFTAYF